MELSALSHVKHVSISEMNAEGITIRDACLAIRYLLYAVSSANTKYIRTVKDAKAVAINVANDTLNITFIG